MVKITIDSRETLLCNHFRRVPDANIGALDLGDILIEGETDTIVIERKTLPDLAASIQDGRHREQKARLIAQYPLNRILFLIEGEIGADPKSMIGRVPKSTLTSSMLNTMFRDGIQVARTISTHETIALIEALAEKMKKGDFVSAPRQISADAHYCSMLKVKKSDNNTPSVCFIKQLTFIPGVSTSMADAIIKVYPSMAALIGALSTGESKVVISCIAEIKHGARGRRIGPKAAEKIYLYLMNDELKK